MTKEELIQSDKFYSIQMIHKLRLFEWIESYDALKRLIIRDITENDNNVFKAVSYGKGTGKRYKIKGTTLISLLRKVKQGYTFNN